MRNADRDYEYAEAIKPIRLQPNRAPIVLTAVQCAAVLLFIACLFLIFGTFDEADKIEREAQMKVLRAERAAEAKVAPLGMPVDYEVSVRQSLPSGREPVTRFYSRTSQKEGK